MYFKLYWLKTKFLLFFFNQKHMFPGILFVIVKKLTMLSSVINLFIAINVIIPAQVSYFKIDSQELIFSFVIMNAKLLVISFSVNESEQNWWTWKCSFWRQIFVFHWFLWILCPKKLINLESYSFDRLSGSRSSILPAISHYIYKWFVEHVIDSLS